MTSINGNFRPADQPKNRPADRPADLDNIKSPDWSKVKKIIEVDDLTKGNISNVAFVDLIHLNYLNDNICCSRKTRKMMKV